jgi:hypothetical protein
MMQPAPDIETRLKTAQEDVAYCENLAKKILVDIQNMWVIESALDANPDAVLEHFRAFLLRLDADMHTIIGNASTQEK